jgi:hypothetical protein
MNKLIAQESTHFLISFSTSGVSEASYFNNANIIRFLNQFKLLGENHGVSNNNLITKIPEYCEPELQKVVKA